MFSTLPDLTPRDLHSLWYISSRNPSLTPSHLDPNFLYSNSGENGVPLPPGTASGAGAPTTGRHNTGTTPSQNNNRSAAHQAAVIERSALGRLRADELYMERRRANVANLGSTWLKPPGVAKTLFQMREERREQEEHAEAMRREMLAQELAEAEAAGVAAGEEGGDDAMGMEGEVVGGDNMMMDDDGEENAEGGRDLDDDIPDADEGGFGFDGISDDEEEEEEESSEEESEETDEDDQDDGDGLDDSPRRHRREMANRIGNMRATEDAMRERLATHGTASQRHLHSHAPGGGDLYGGDEDIDEEDQADILEEDDLLQGGYDDLDPGMEDDLDMDANLDDEIPEAGSLGGYEHTDSEAELSSEVEEDEDEERDMSYALPGPSGGSARRNLQQHQFGRNSAHRISSSGAYALPPYSPRDHQGQYHHQQQRQPHHRNRNSLASSHREGGGGQRSSLDISGLLSQDGSSVIGSSPRMRRAN